MRRQPRRPPRALSGGCATAWSLAIAAGCITTAMATSLMNDSTYAFTAAERLLDVTRVLAAPTDSAHREMDMAISLSESEIEQLIDRSPEGSP